MFAEDLFLNDELRGKVKAFKAQLLMDLKNKLERGKRWFEGAKKGFINTLRFMLQQAERDPNFTKEELIFMPNRRGSTALHMVSYRGFGVIVKTLLKEAGYRSLDLLLLVNDKAKNAYAYSNGRMKKFIEDLPVYKLHKLLPDLSKPTCTSDQIKAALPKLMGMTEEEKRQIYPIILFYKCANHTIRLALVNWLINDSQNKDTQDILIQMVGDKRIIFLPQMMLELYQAMNKVSASLGEKFLDAMKIRPNLPKELTSLG